MKMQRFGGSFAPPLSDDLLSKYGDLVERLDESALKDGLKSCLACCHAWWAQPESTGDGRPHPSGTGVIVDLDDHIREALDPHVPWKEEVDHVQALCDQIPETPENKVLRDCAFHLVWHARELCLDREPITADKL